MQKTKLIRLLHSLQDKEWRELADFVTSPYFNQDEELSRLLDVLKHWVSSGDIEEKSQADLFRALWPRQAYDAKQLTYAMSRLNKLAEYYLGLQKVESDPLNIALATLEVSSERKLDKHYAATQRTIVKALRTPQTNSATDFRNRARYMEILDQHYVRQRNRVFDSSIQEAATELDKFYYLRRLQLACSMLDRQHILESVYQLDLSPAWISHLQQSVAGQSPIIQVYLTIFQMLSEEGEGHHFAQLKAQLQGYADEFLAEDLAGIYQFGINYCARKIRQGEESYVAEALQLYTQGIESGILIVEGQLSPWTYANVCKLYLRQKQYDAAHTFIEKFLPLLPESFQHNAYHYNLAELYYYTQQSEQAQAHLIQVAYSDLNYYLGARVLLAKIYYETGEEDALSSLLAAFLMFLKRNKALSQNIKETYLNFCKILARILRSTPDKYERIRAHIHATRFLTDRDWLLRICGGASAETE
jgi:tetratricopeptide (TPR) repeat protein